MLNKPADVLYCNVNPDKIRKAKPVLDEEVRKHLIEVVTERYKIRLRKDVQKLPPPWTNNVILQDYRFTNVRREHDRESLWLIHNISRNASISYYNKIANSILFRLFNKKETMEALGGFVDFEKPLDIILLQSRVDDYIAKYPKYTFFTNAFFSSGMRNAIRKEQLELSGNLDPRLMIVEKVDRIMKGSGLPFLTFIENSTNQKQIFDELTKQRGIAGFLGYQIFVDLSYIEEFPYSENEFTIAGPGCQKGINTLFLDRDGMSYEESIFWLRDHFEDINFYELFEDLEEHDRCSNVMSWENICCDFLCKYVKTVRGAGRPKNKYRESLDPLPGDSYIRPSLLDFSTP